MLEDNTKVSFKKIYWNCWITLLFNLVQGLKQKGAEIRVLSNVIVRKLRWVQSESVGENLFNVKIIVMWGWWRYKPHRSGTLSLFEARSAQAETGLAQSLSRIFPSARAG